MGIWLEGLAALCLSPLGSHFPSQTVSSGFGDLSSNLGFEVNLAIWGDTQWRGRKGCLWPAHMGRYWCCLSGSLNYAHSNCWAQPLGPECPPITCDGSADSLLDSTLFALTAPHACRPPFLDLGILFQPVLLS